MFKTVVTDKVKTLKPSDRGFRFTSGNLTMFPRAGFEINQQCPREYKMIISECIDRGWLLPVAYIKDSEYMWEQLGA